MPRGLFNWDFEDVVEFLKQHFFVLSYTDGSHFYFKGVVNKKQKLVHIQKHTDKAIRPKTLETIIYKSGIPKKIWKSWGQAGSKSARKKINYSGAK